MTHDQWLKDTAEEFANAMIPTARLDAEILLAHTLNKPRTWLHAHGDEVIDPRRADIANARAALRLERVPIAYIIGHKEFYGRRFIVSPDVLIPRPESEALIELLRQAMTRHPNARHAVDVGTGSGCLGITAKLEWPQLDMTLIDRSKKALTVASRNATAHHAQVRMLSSNLLDRYPLRADVIIANLPYVDADWPELSPEIANEPALALFANHHGLELINELLRQTPRSLAPGGSLLLEADPRQHQEIIASASRYHLELSASLGFGLTFTSFD